MHSTTPTPFLTEREFQIAEQLRKLRAFARRDVRNGESAQSFGLSSRSRRSTGVKTSRPR